MKKGKILLLISLVAIIALIVWLSSRSAIEQKEQAGTPEQEIVEEGFNADASIETGDLEEYGKMINELDLGNLDAEFEAIDGLVKEL